jgi:outer membrane immunogenic protein
MSLGSWGKHSFESRDLDMKRVIILAAATIAVGAAAPAVAADLPARAPAPYTKAPAMVQAAYDWSGFYIGINGGGATGSTDWSLDTGAGDDGSHHTTGGTVGGQIGYRWQLNSWVFGVEAQGNWANFSGSNTALVTPNTTNQTQINAFGLFTGQIGYAVDRALFYVNGGAAVTDSKYTSVTTGAPPVGGIDSINDTRWGAAVGAGFEYAFAPNWSVGFEYDHLFMGNKDINDGLITENIKTDVDLFTARLNYKFGFGGGPVMARY